MATTIQVKRGLSTSSAWSSLNLLAGEFAFLTDTKKLYIGDGTTKVLLNPTLGTAAVKDAGVLAGNVPVLDANGLLPVSTLPPLAMTEVFTVNSEAAMLALTAQPGDIAIRTDINETYVLAAAPASTIGNWKKLLTPTGAVTSVAGKTGVVTLDGRDVSLTGYVIGTAGPLATTDTVNTALGKLEAGLNGKAPIASPTFTGTVIVPTPTVGDNSTKAATTAFVSTAINNAIGSVNVLGTIISGYVNPSGTSLLRLTATDTVMVAFNKLDNNSIYLQNVAISKAPKDSPSFTGTVDATGAVTKVATAASTTNDTTAASTAFVRNALGGAASVLGTPLQGYVKATTPVALTPATTVLQAFQNLEGFLDTKANLSGATFTGDVIVVLPNNPADDTLLAAPCKWVNSRIAANTDKFVKSVNGIAPTAATGLVTVGAGNILATGYTKAATFTPIVATDSVNQALGKLEKGFDLIDGGTF